MDSLGGKPTIDVLEINRLRRQLLLLSYVWDQRLISAASMKNTIQKEFFLSPVIMGKFVSSDGAVGSATSKASVERKDNEHSSGPDISHDHEEREKSSDQVDGGVKEVNRPKDLHEEVEAAPTTLDSNIIHQSVVSERTLQKVASEKKLSIMSNLSDTLDAAWTGENYFPVTVNHVDKSHMNCTFDLVEQPIVENAYVLKPAEDHVEAEVARSFSLSLPPKGSLNFETSTIRLGSSADTSTEIIRQKLSLLAEYNPSIITSFQELARQGGARLFLPPGFNGVVVPVYDDEPTSIISYALVSPEYYFRKSELEKSNDSLESAVSLPSFDLVNSLSVSSKETSVSSKSLGFSDGIASRSKNIDPLLPTIDPHVIVSFTDDGPPGKAKFTVTCYYAKRFENLRQICCPSELDFVRSLSRCKKWGAQGGKSNVFFAKTLDDRFIIKQVTKTELESFIQFAPAYFKYLTESISTRSPTCLAKILGIYQVLSPFIIISEF